MRASSRRRAAARSSRRRRIVDELHALNGRSPGVTFNVGVIRGGTRPNVVAERCELEVDVRAVTREGLVGAEASLHEVLARTSVPDVTVELAVTHRWWPMEKLERSGRLVDHARGAGVAARVRARRTRRRAARPMGTRRRDRGAHDRRAGPIGGLDHSPGEYLEVSSIVPRTTLLAGLLASIGGSRDRGLAAGAARRRPGGCDGRRRRRSGGRLTVRRSDDTPPRLQRGSVGGLGRLLAGARRRRCVLGRRHDRRGAGRRVASSR